MPGWNHENCFKPKPCVVCSTYFKPKSGVHRFCSETCKGKWQYISETHSTENQYKNISGNWERYVARLLYHGGRKRDKLTKDILLKKTRRAELQVRFIWGTFNLSVKEGGKGSNKRVSR